MRHPHNNTAAQWAVMRAATRLLQLALILISLPLSSSAQPPGVIPTPYTLNPKP